MPKTAKYSGPPAGEIVTVLGAPGPAGPLPAIVWGGEDDADGTWVDVTVFPSLMQVRARWTASAEAAAELHEEPDNDATSVAFPRSSVAGAEPDPADEAETTKKAPKKSA